MVIIVLTEDGTYRGRCHLVHGCTHVRPLRMDELDALATCAYEKKNRRQPLTYVRVTRSTTGHGTFFCPITLKITL